MHKQLIFIVIRFQDFNQYINSYKECREWNQFTRVSDWPEKEKPREKLLDKGADALSDAELLAIFLRTGIKGCHVVDLARKLLLSFG